MMRNYDTIFINVFVIGALAFGTGMTGCPSGGGSVPGGNISSGLIGIWSGTVTANITSNVTEPFQGTQTFSFQSELTLEITSNGKPAVLNYGVFIGGSNAGGISANIFEVGQTRTFTTSATVNPGTGGPVTINTTATLTVNQASFSDSEIDITYGLNQTTLYSGGALDGQSQVATGTSRYQISLDGQMLDYTQTTDTSYTSDFGGSTSSGTQHAVATGTLTKS